MLRTPPDVLITTPESLYLMLTSRAREFLAEAESVIVDEIHAVARTKRGAHLALTLERLEHVAGKPLQRIGLSATQRPLEEVGRFLVGAGRDCRIVDTGVRKPLDLRDPGAGRGHARAGRPRRHRRRRRRPGHRRGRRRPDRHRARRRARHPALDLAGDLPRAARAGARAPLDDRLREQPPRRRAPGGAAERARRRGRGPADIARAHHGSLAREERLVVEDLLKSGELPCLVATSSLELGIDMGAVDLVLQVESPKSVTAGLQRIGRAGHGVGEVSKGRIFPKFRADLLECAVVAQRMRDGEIEPTVVPRNPLDVLAQQIVAMTATGDEWQVPELHELVRRAYPFAELSRELLDKVLDMLDGRYPSEEFSELRPRIVWDRVEDTIRARKGALQLAVTNAGTIPDRGLYGVHLPDGRRVGELDEEMVYEARPGQTFLLGASTWRIEEITRDRVIVTPAPGRARRACRSGAATAWAGPRSWARRSARSRARRWTASPRELAGRVRPGRARRAQPRRLPARAARGHARGAERPHDRDRALPRRDRRLAPVRAVALRRPRARRLGAGAVGARSATSSASSPTRSGPTTGSSSTCPTPTRRPARRARAGRARRARGAGGARAVRLGAVRRALPRERRPRAAAARAPARASARRCGSSG